MYICIALDALITPIVSCFHVCIQFCLCHYGMESKLKTVKSIA